MTGAIDAFTGGVGRRIDAAEVNGRMFLNNTNPYAHDSPLARGIRPALDTGQPAAARFALAV